MLQGVSGSHQRCSGVIPDASRSILSMFMKIDFSMNFPGLAWRRVLRTPPLLLGGVPQVVRSILLQVPRGRQIAQRGILQSALRRPLYHPITFPDLHQFKYPRFESQ